MSPDSPTTSSSSSSTKSAMSSPLADALPCCRCSYLIVPHIPSLVVCVNPMVFTIQSTDASSLLSPPSPHPPPLQGRAGRVLILPTMPSSLKAYEWLWDDWMKSSLFSASARHHLLQPIIREHTSQESLIMKDANGEGGTSYGQGSARGDAEEAYPIIIGQDDGPCIWDVGGYVPTVKLAGKVVLKEAMLVAVLPRPSRCGKKADKANGSLDWIKEEFDREGEGIVCSGCSNVGQEEEESLHGDRAVPVLV